MNIKNCKGSMLALLATFGLSSIALAATTQRYIVEYAPGVAKQLSGEIGQGKIKAMLNNRNLMSVELTNQEVQSLTLNPKIKSIEIDAKRYPLAQTTPYGIPMVQATQLSDAAAANTMVCIIDSGYDLSHEDLASSSNISGTNDSGTGNWFSDEHGHGTHVAGTIAALDNTLGVIGVLPNNNLNLHIIKVFDADGWAYSSTLVTALDNCVAAQTAAGLDKLVINMSLGGSRSVRSEDRAFGDAYAAGVLSIAAAGNDGNTRHSYPASYDSVVSVAAIDANKVVAAFSQQTDQVELAAPGVAVESSLPMGTATSSDVTVAGNGYESAGMVGSPFASATGSLVDCGLGTSACTGATGNICLISRGDIAFSDKVLACEAGGGAGAIIYNNEPDMLYGTLGEVATSIPSVGVSQADGATLVGLVGSSATVDVYAGNYSAWDGTSMATPHVAGVAALVWSNNPSCSASEIRAALVATAEDLGAAGRDNAYGHGLVQAKAAHDHIAANACTGDNGGGDTGGGGGGNGGGNGKPKKN
ncbi:S8 family serine peptidase [Paraferrimonas sp. SM1919]|uniref:S8 family serine peptidase n=1 Tax=Paraferrimonas sp. SM1919 TaxID=2662263 RepID=UPI00196A09F3|nr:S8 family serine peptidase [Paraferrimonas sp. SM1919]